MNLYYLWIILQLNKQPDDEGTEWVDKEEDRSIDDELYGRMVKVF